MSADIIPHSTIVEMRNIGTVLWPIILSICLSTIAHSSMLPCIWYHDQVHVLYMHHALLVLLCVCFDISEKNVLNLFKCGTVIRCHTLLMLVKLHLALCQIGAIGVIFA